MNAEYAEMLPDFLAESSEIIQRIHTDLEDARARAPSERGEQLNSIYRAFHTLKGMVSMFGMDEAYRLAHEVEGRLSRMRDTGGGLQDPDLQSLAGEADRIEELISAGAALPQTEAARAAPENSAAQPALQDSAPQSAPRSGTEMIRVPAQRIQRSLDMISEALLIRNQIAYLMEKRFSGPESEREFYQSWEVLDATLKRCITELESIGMSMRMMPASSLFGRMAKTVRAYLENAPKKIRFVTEGEETELDKKVLDALGEPLIHLIRNAMDHGIETSEERKAAGKPEEGSITLRARLIGNEVVLEVSDDGRGMDGEKLKRKAAERGIDVSHIRDERSALNLIFVPGFSTAEKVTETSGRGVGMDAVQSSIERMGGSIQIRTVVGGGTTFTISLPVGVSLIPAIILRVGGQLLAVATHDLAETRLVPARDLRSNAGGLHLPYRGGFVPCHDLELKLGLSARKRADDDGSVDLVDTRRARAVCLVRTDQGIVAMAATAFEYNTEIVVKPVPARAASLEYVTGVSLLPTGEPVFVVSLSRYFRHRIQDSSRKENGYEQAG